MNRVLGFYFDAGVSKQSDMKLVGQAMNGIHSSLVTACLGLQWYKLEYLNFF